MGYLQIHKKHGYIIGGLAEKRMKARLSNNNGARIYINWLNKHKALKKKPYFIKLLFIPKEKSRQWWGITGEMGIYAAKDVFLYILENRLLNVWIPKQTLTKWINGNLDYYGTMGKGTAKWEKQALKDKDLRKELTNK